MRQRVRALGGDFQIRGKPRAGTTLEVDIPLKPAGVASSSAPAATTREGRAAAAV
jgi:signal transduction histidine kinase